MSSILNIVKTAVAVIGLILALLFLRKGMRPLMLVRRADEPASLEAGAAAALGAGEAGADQADRPGSVDADGNPLPAGGVDASSPTTALPAVSAEGSPVPGQPAGAATGTAGAGTGAAGVPGTGPAGHDGNEPRGDASLVESDPSAASTIDMLQLIDQQHDEVAELLRGWMAEVG